MRLLLCGDVSPDESVSRRVFRRVQDLVSTTLNSREFLVG